jgi:hypothetical protein
MSMEYLGALLHQRGRHADAEPFLLEAVEGWRERFGDGDLNTQRCVNSFIRLYEAWGKPENAAEWRAKLP